MAGMRVAVRQERRIDPSLSEAHRREAVQMRGLRTVLRQERSPRAAHETASPQTALQVNHPSDCFPDAIESNGSPIHLLLEPRPRASFSSDDLSDAPRDSNRARDPRNDLRGFDQFRFKLSLTRSRGTVVDSFEKLCQFAESNPTGRAGKQGAIADFLILRNSPSELPINFFNSRSVVLTDRCPRN